MGLSPSAPGASPLAITRAVLSLASKAIRPLGYLGGDPTWGEHGGVSLSDQVRSLQAADLDIPTGVFGESVEGMAAGAGEGAGVALPSLGPALPYIAAALPAIMSFSRGGPKTDIEAANLGVDTAAAAAAPFTWGASLAASGIARGIEDLISGASPLQTILDFGGLGMFQGLFDKPGSYGPKRQAAGEEAMTAFSSLSGALATGAEQFMQTGDPAGVLTALQTQFGDRNPVRSELFLPPEVAEQLGMAAQPAAVPWSTVTPEQFQQLLGLMAAAPDQGASWIRGSGDVAYLPQADAQQVADQAAGDTRAVLAFMIGQRGAPVAEAPTPAPPVTPTGPEGALGFAEDIVSA